MAEALDEQRQQKRQQEDQAAAPLSSAPVTSSYRKVRVPEWCCVSLPISCWTPVLVPLLGGASSYMQQIKMFFLLS